MKTHSDVCTNAQFLFRVLERLLLMLVLKVATGWIVLAQGYEVVCSYLAAGDAPLPLVLVCMHNQMRPRDTGVYKHGHDEVDCFHGILRHLQKLANCFQEQCSDNDPGSAA